MKALFSSLGVRLLIPLFMIVAVVLAIHAALSFRSINEHFLSFVAAEADRTSGLIQRATHDGMLLNRLDDVQQLIEHLAAEPEVAAIRVYDPRGRIVLSSARTEIGGSARANEAHDVVRKRTMLQAEPACMASGCHAGAGRSDMLGSLEVDMSMLPLESALASARRQLAATTLVLMLVIGAAALLIVRRLIANDLRRTRMEAAEWSQQLEAKVAEKTKELQSVQRQVLHMEKMASLGKLSAMVAHELNNPMSGMLTYARLIERELTDQPLDPVIRKQLEGYLHLVQGECARCGGIVQNLLVFARSGASAPAPVDVNRVVERGLMLIRHQLDISGIHLETQLLRGDSTIVADAGQLEQALVALFINASEAMSQGGRLSVRLNGNADDVVIEIADNGSGIAPDVLPQIFEPFFSTKTESGSGLGLAVVYGIVHRHGGSIRVHSDVGLGTTFELRFPRVPPPEDEQVLETHMATAGAIA